MKALVYNGPRDVSVTDVADPVIELPTDALVSITTTNICGSDLHMYEGRTDFESGRVIGHENQGEVVAVGDDVERCRWRHGHAALQRLLWLLPELRAWTHQLLPHDEPGGRRRRRRVRLRRHGPLSGRPGRLPPGSPRRLNALVLPDDAGRRRTTTSCWPTSGRPATTPPFWPGSNPAIRSSSSGPDPSGSWLPTRRSSRAPARCSFVDRHPDRLRLAESIGAIPIDDSQVSPVDQIMDATDGIGADARMRVRRLPGPRPAGPRGPDPDHEHPDPFSAVQGRSRRRGGVPSPGSRWTGRARTGTARSRSTGGCSGSRPNESGRARHR